MVLGAAQVLSDDDKAPAEGMPQMTPEMLALMEQCMANMNPGEHHKVLQGFVGSWKTTSKFWYTGEGNGPPMVTEGKSEVRSVLGGRFIMEEHHGELKMPNDKGELTTMPHDGIGMVGYDNDRNMYVGSWFSNVSTAMLTYTGNPSRDGKTITFYGQMDEPMLKTFGRHVRYVISIVNKDRRVFSLYDLHAGDNYKVIEVTYDRAK